MNISNIVQNGVTLSTANQNTSGKTNETQNRMALILGVILIFLPIFLWLGGQVAVSCMRDAFSNFYYAPFQGTFFVGGLFVAGAYFIALKGDHWLERGFSNFAGIAVIAIAAFPTEGSGCEKPVHFSRVFAQLDKTGTPTEPTTYIGGFFELFGGTGNIHNWAVAGAVLYFALYCFFIHKGVRDYQRDTGGAVAASKINRNKYYFWCGVVIAACGVAMLYSFTLDEAGLKKWDGLDLTFYIETIAFWAFGVTWVIKSRLIKSLND